MTFLSATWITTAVVGLVALSLPIIIHYLFRSRYRVMDWAAMDFLRQSLEEATRKIRFREFLLLLLRMALLALLAFSLMRPSSQNMPGSGETPVDAVFIMDVSGSMAVQEGNVSRLEASKRAALQILESLPTQSTIQIVQTGLHPSHLGPASPTNRDQARFLLDNLVVSHEPAYLTKSLVLAANLLVQSTLPNKEVYLFSDMQRSEWSARQELVIAWKALQEIGQVILVQSPQDAQPANATLLQLRPQAMMPLPGDRVPFFLEVRNVGNTALSGLTVSIYSGNGERDAEIQPLPALQPGETVTASLSTRLEQQGINLITAELQGDEFLADNRQQLVLETREKLRLLIIDGEYDATEPARSASFFLGHALKSLREVDNRAAESPVEIRIISAQEVLPTDMGGSDICIMVGSQAQERCKPEVLQRLARFVDQGGSLMIFTNVPISDSGLVELADILPARGARPFRRNSDSPLQFDGSSIPSASFLAPFRSSPFQRVLQTEVTQGCYWSEIHPDTVVVLRYTDLTPALLYRQAGKGSVILSGFRADLQGTDFPLKPGFVPWIQAMVSHAVNQQLGKKNILAGETYTWFTEHQQVAQRYELITPDGLQRHPLGKPQLVGNRYVLQTDKTQQAGVYRIVPETGREEIEAEGATSDLFTVAAQASETANLTALDAEQLKEYFETSPVILKAEYVETPTSLRSRIQQEWTMGLW
ncbi:MAG TPA: BatA domain-containing protein, partial [Gemmatales bacterium]|nr:BatA domain-containing protein [Gemmatales bacterium]